MNEILKNKQIENIWNRFADDEKENFGVLHFEDFKIEFEEHFDDLDGNFQLCEDNKYRFFDSVFKCNHCCKYYPYEKLGENGECDECSKIPSDPSDEEQNGLNQR